ncbi:WAP four-disulfide core domain protein 18-like isoform X2 [Actinia tenebrosa]|uniref:WAP four-disulfide core domain protein 18-like isoform X2 n=1 Tax=Actinia tenebrosa TaxID=6105 RepID=A0A6P8IN28_ACTTE|nr:WAP four-disulfide core domain protein 18-like isoform X2 [Actinia tenebrosa]
MKKSAFLGIGILIVMFFITTQAHPIQPDRFIDTILKRKRTGSCPKPGIGLCAELCGSGCPYGQLCCFNGCGHECMDAV